MVDRDQDGNVKKSWKERLDELVGKVPGLSDFLSREKMREQDKVLRSFSAERITKLKGAVDGIKTGLLSQGKIGLLDDVDQLSKKLDRARDTHRFDAYGFAGMFDANKVMGEELAKLYEYDLKILEQIDKAQNVLGSMSASFTEEDVQQALPVMRETVNSLLDTVLERKNVLTNFGS